MQSKKRLIVFFIFMGLFALSYQLGALSTVNEEDAAKFLEEFKSLVDGIDGFGIFVHNLTIALPMFVPGFGVIWGMFSGWSTGFAFASIVSTTPALASFPPLAILFLSPFGIMELVAYSLGISRSYMWMYSILKHQSVRPQFISTGIEIAVVIGLLVAGGYIEYAMVEATKTLTPPIGGI